MSTPPLTGGSGWPTIEQAVQTLSQSDPKLAQQLQQALPQASPRLAAAMMAFTHALRSGDPRSWPGEPVVKGLEKANSKLAKQLGDDLSEMANRSADASKGEWRAFTLPFSNGQEIEKIQLYVHKDPQEEENSEARPKEDGARFLIDLDLSRLGPLQMDGYVVSKSRRFDLILRTEQPMEREVRMNVLAMFNNAIDALGLTGTASFLVTQQFVRPQLSRPETAGVGLSGLVV
ncbi:MAG: hypothetical protein A2516_07640 [Alphaproteobacteria bacterium RIFOXYD12_FULL_60_8]|nr:MAG: hypothetical protein A2516_07640 [Alphaproteobacteria bacterium RIFOXYD12_FULL_60_8]